MVRYALRRNGLPALLAGLLILAQMVAVLGAATPARAAAAHGRPVTSSVSTLTNATTACAGIYSPGYWMNWSNHYSYAQFVAIIGRTLNYASWTPTAVERVLNTTAGGAAEYARHLMAAELNAAAMPSLLTETYGGVSVRDLLGEAYDHRSAPDTSALYYSAVFYLGGGGEQGACQLLPASTPTAAPTATATATSPAPTSTATQQTCGCHGAPTATATATATSPAPTATATQQTCGCHNVPTATATAIATSPAPTVTPTTQTCSCHSVPTATSTSIATTPPTPTNTPLSAATSTPTATQASPTTAPSATATMTSQVLGVTSGTGSHDVTRVVTVVKVRYVVKVVVRVRYVAKVRYVKRVRTIIHHRVVYKTVQRVVRVVRYHTRVVTVRKARLVRKVLGYRFHRLPITGRMAGAVFASYTRRPTADARLSIARLRVSWAPVWSRAYIANRDGSYRYDIVPFYGATRFSASARFGQRGLTLLSGHDDIGGSIFRDLGRMRRGDAIQVWQGHRHYRYVVTSIAVVTPTNVSLLNAARTRPTLAMISCTPYMVDTHRVIVIAEMR